MTTNIPERLQALLELVPKTRVLADIGCDHARLACAAVASGRARGAIAVDASARALARGRATVERAGLSERVELRRGWGLAPLCPNEAEVVVIAGIGGRNVLDILAAGGRTALGVATVIVQPNRDEARVREELARAGWGLVAEALPGTRARVFPSMRFDRGAPVWVPSPLEALLGPHLLAHRPPAFARLVRRRCDELARKPDADPELRRQLELVWAETSKPRGGSAGST